MSNASDVQWPGSGDRPVTVVARIELVRVDKPTCDSVADLLAAISRLWPGCVLRGAWPGTMEVVVEAEPGGDRP